ncbi:MAG: DUF2461 domain-containing protein [Amphiplicatus sp.]
MPEFQGLPKDYFAFFAELKENNNRAWFEANKARFKESVQAPLSAFVEAMGPRLKKISKHFTADPRLNGGSIFRIYRDVRFAKDKKPYKENGGVHFRHALGRDAHAPGFYVHIAPDEIFYGGGIWAPPPPALAKIREAIRDNGKKWGAAVSGAAFKKRYGGVRGDALSRPPRGFAGDHPLIEDIKRKSFFAMAEGTRKRALSPVFAGDVEAAMRDAKPLMTFLCEALGAPI